MNIIYCTFRRLHSTISCDLENEEFVLISVHAAHVAMLLCSIHFHIFRYFSLHLLRLIFLRVSIVCEFDRRRYWSCSRCNNANKDQTLNIITFAGAAICSFMQSLMQILCFKGKLHNCTELEQLVHYYLYVLQIASEQKSYKMLMSFLAVLSTRIKKYLKIFVTTVRKKTRISWVGL